jgi:hypothetical protein
VDPYRNVVLGFLLVLSLIVPARSMAQDAPPPDSEAEPAELGEAAILSAGPLEYRPGRGLRLGDTGLVLGGFTTIKGESTEDSGGEFAIDRLNFFLILDRFTRFRAVAELQLRDIFTADEHTSGSQDFAFDVRRLFADVTASDALRARVGTFLTPVGYWNLILAPPLTWTTEAPLIVEETFFQQTTTGVMLHGSTGVARGRLGYSLFSQFLKPLEDDPDLDPPDHTAGFRLAYDRGPAWSAGASTQASENDGEWSYMGGAHFRWQPRRGEVLSELYVQNADTESSVQWGTYLQGAFNVHGPFYAVGRYEYFDPPSERAVNVVTLGGVFKPLPFMAIKVEYRFSDHDSGDEDLRGFFTSFTTFF